MEARLCVDWVADLLGGEIPGEGEQAVRQGRTLITLRGLVRDLEVADPGQRQTREAFAFKWAQRDTYNSPALDSAQIAWLDARYGERNLLQHLGAAVPGKPLVLDAGAGAGFTARLLLRDLLDSVRYVGADISSAIDIAQETLGPRIADSFFVQADLTHLPFREGAFDIVVSEGVMHHTPSTRTALLALARQVKPGGIFAFYVYAKKAPIREFTDDYIRAQLVGLSPEEAWTKVEPLTRLGIALGELNAEIDIPEDVEVLGIKQGRVNLQRLFYWAICKTYYRPEFSFEEMQHINFDWFTPTYSHRQTPEEVTAWCHEAGLAIEHMKVEEAGITVVARRPTG